MAKFIYTAMNNAGKEVKGKVEAASESAAISELKKQGLFASSIKAEITKSQSAQNAKKKSGSLFEINLGPKVIRTKDLTVVTRQLATLLGAGLPLIRSLRTLERQSKEPMTKKVLGETADAVESGSTFAEALAQNPKTFDKLYLNMVRAGEASGAMETILDRLAQFMEKSARIKGKVKAALVYPTVVLCLSILIMAGLMVFVVPNFKKIFEDLLGGKELPAITQFVLGISDLLAEQWYIPVGVVVGFIVLIKLMGKFDGGRYILDYCKYKGPLFGMIISLSAISRFCRTTGTLMSSGVPVLNALTIVKDTSGNEVVSRAVEKVYEAVKEGEGIAGPLGETKIFPQMVISMVEVGEETGKLPEMLDKIANTYEEEVDNAVSGLTSMIEPLMIVGLAVIVGTIVVALFMPMTSIVTQMS